MKMKGLDAYKLALARGLSGKEAAYEYGIKYHTLWTAGFRHKLPPLVKDNRRNTMYLNMSDEQLLKYHASLVSELQHIEKLISSKPSPIQPTAGVGNL
jgi:hypothetical protein